MDTKSSLLLFDELDASLHPILTQNEEKLSENEAKQKNHSTSVHKLVNALTVCETEKYTAVEK